MLHSAPCRVQPQQSCFRDHICQPVLSQLWLPPPVLSLHQGTRSSSLAAIDYDINLQELHNFHCTEIKYAQASQDEQVDRQRLSAPLYKVGDEVWLSRRHIRTICPSQKLVHMRLDRFKILACVNSHAYKLDLPFSMKIHTIFHLSLLESTHNDSIPGHVPPVPPPIIVGGEGELDVEEILDSSRRRKKLE